MLKGTESNLCWHPDASVPEWASRRLGLALQCKGNFQRTDPGASEGDLPVSVSIPIKVVLLNLKFTVFSVFKLTCIQKMAYSIFPFWFIYLLHNVLDYGNWMLYFVSVFEVNDRVGFTHQYVSSSICRPTNASTRTLRRVPSERGFPYTVGFLTERIRALYSSWCPARGSAKWKTICSRFKMAGPVFMTAAQIRNFRALTAAAVSFDAIPERFRTIRRYWFTLSSI